LAGDGDTPIHPDTFGVPEQPKGTSIHCPGTNYEKLVSMAVMPQYIVQ